MTDARLRTVTDFWYQHGCPEKMTLHVGGETITLVNGLPITPQKLAPEALSSHEVRRSIAGQPVRDNRTCSVCGTGFHSKREDALYCSSRCQKRAARYVRIGA